MRRSPRTISPAQRDAMRHMLLAGIAAREIAPALKLRSSKRATIWPRRKPLAEVWP